MVIITGAAGFIGSNLTGYLNGQGMENIILVDIFDNELKIRNLSKKQYLDKIYRDEFFDWLDQNHEKVKFVLHIGARTDTAEFDRAVFNRLNLGYSKRVWESCTRYQIPLIYASSAATYGSGEHGYNDDHALVNELKPLNPYGESKNDFDKWVLDQKDAPPFWAGLKFFNVYGPNEYHKGRMASVILHTFNQIMDSGRMKLFRSHKPGVPDGGQARDFIYVKDVVRVIFWLYSHKPESGLYNLGTGKARTFLDLAVSTFRAMNLEPRIEFIDTPMDIRDKYQYFTEARMEKLQKAGYKETFYSLEEGISDYVRNYLIHNKYS
jgi:ADP-L-glycero-D-manno-heptose 6-epimerase